MLKTLPYDRTGYLYVMKKHLKEKIISLYNTGKSSLKISDELGISKPTVLKILNEEGIVRKKERCKSLMIFDDNNKFSLFWTCEMCKKEIKRSSKNKTILCRNHFRQIEVSGICKKCSLKLQEGENNPFYGKKHSQETKSKVSKSRKGKYCGDLNHMKIDKFRKKSGQIFKHYWDNFGDKKKMSEMMKEKHRQGKIKNTPFSKDEVEISDQIKSMNYDVIRSFRIDSKIFDIFVPSLNLIIEYNGDYWHCNPEKYDENYLNKKKNKTAKELWDYDNLKLELAKNKGYNLEVIWESNYKKNKNLINLLLAKYDKSNYTAPERS